MIPLDRPPHRPWCSPAYASAAWLLLAASALAGPGQTLGGGNEPDKVDSENLFGFTEGTDTGKRGEQEVILDTITRLSKRRAGPGRSGYAAAQPVISYQYDPSDNLSVEPGLYLDARDSRNVAGVPDKGYATFNGGSVELKYQFVKRTDASPYSVALQAEPQYARVTPVEGQGADLFTADTRLIADARLVSGKLWAGANLVFTPTVARLKGSGEVDRSSTLAVQGTLAMQVGAGVFVGPELRYMRAYDGAYLNRFLGDAVFLGPVVNYQVAEKGYVTVAYSAQVAGLDRDPAFAGRAFNLNQFPRHALRMRLGVEF